MRTVRYTSHFRRDYRREKSGRHGRRLDAELLETVTMLAKDEPLPRRYFDHPLGGEWSDHRDLPHPARPHPDLPQAGRRELRADDSAIKARAQFRPVCVRLHTHQSIRCSLWKRWPQGSAQNSKAIAVFVPYLFDHW